MHVHPSFTTPAVHCRWLAHAALALLLGLGAAGVARADAADLRARWTALQEQLQRKEHGHALHIESAEQPERPSGEVHAVLDHPFATVSGALKDPARWCDILILPFNTKHCQAVPSTAGPMLQVRIGRKYDQPLEQAHKLEFAYTGVAAQPAYFESRLHAATGPMGTRDYRISVAAMPLEGGRTFLQLRYAYGVGAVGRMAMSAYLGTVGADKVGFTTVGRAPDGTPRLVDGVRGAVERNAMRYYLAVDAYLDSLAAPPRQQVEQRIQRWFDATERFPRQLREMDRATYVALKRAEHERQQTALVQ